MDDCLIARAIESQDARLAAEAIREVDLLLSKTTDLTQRSYLLLSKSSCLGVLGKFEEAQQHLILALSERPDDPETVLVVRFNQALLYQQQGDYEQAFERLSKLLAGNRGKLMEPELRFMYEDIQQRRGFLAVTLSRFRDAIPILREVLSFNLEEQVKSEALVSLGLCYLETKDWELAKGHFLQARTIGISKDREKRFHFYLGIAYFHTDVFREARVEFQICERNAAEYDLPLLDVYAWLSRISKLLGEDTEAARYASLSRPT